MRALWATLAALGLCGLAAAAPLGAGGGAAVPARETDDSSLRVAEHIIEPAELEAAPAGTRAVLEQLLEQVQALRGEVGSLRADKLQADARAARLSERVDGLEIMCAGERDGARHAAEAPQPREAQQPRANATTGTEPRRRAQGGQACARVHNFQVLTAAAMDAWPARRQREAAGTGARCRPAATCRLPARRRRARRCSCRSWRTATRC